MGKFRNFIESFGASNGKFGVMGVKPGKMNPIKKAFDLEIKGISLPKPQVMSIAKQTSLKPARPTDAMGGTIKSVI